MCTKGIVLERGRVQAAGDIGTAMAAYYGLIGALDVDAGAGEDAPSGTGFGRVEVCGADGGTIAQSKEFEASTTLTLTEATAGFTFFCHLVDMFGREVFVLRESHTDLGLVGVSPGSYAIRARFPPLWLSPGLYALWFKVQISGAFGSTRHVSDKATIDVEGTSGVIETAILHPTVSWAIDRR